jgi:hypothetical protein
MFFGTNSSYLELIMGKFSKKDKNFVFFCEKRLTGIKMRDSLG